LTDRPSPPPVSSPLQAAVDAAFAHGGPLHRADAGYRRRDVQIELALAVAAAIDARASLVVEAGTGVGKTFGYLVPALLSGQRVLVSTATKTLQDQLFKRDLPRLKEALQVPVSLALLKGRSSYLCLHRLAHARQDAQLPDRFAVRLLARIERWAQSTPSGDLAELDGLDERSPMLPLVTSTRDNCLGSECPRFKDCHLIRARREALAADVVVVNHHLFFADVALRDSGVSELLPSVEVAVFDEAHQLADAGIAFLGKQLGTGQCTDLARDILGAGLQFARGLAPWQDLAAACDRRARELRLVANGPLRDVRGVIKLRWDERARGEPFVPALQAVQAAFDAAAEALDTVSEIAPDFVRLAERARELSARALAFTEPPEADSVRWIDVGPNQARLIESPLDIRAALDEQRRAAPKTWIFTSATLGDDEALTWFTDSAGLADAVTLKVGSPFDYPRHARLHVPAGIPKPNEVRHPEAVADLAYDLARALDGRTFVLTTTLRSLASVAERLEDRFAEDGSGIAVLAQGRLAKRELMARFLENPRSVLVGSQSFWEGVDVRGTALQCVLIDKLPFPPPNDPLVEARVRRLRREGRSPFDDYHLPEAAVALKQGAGRLIRSENDEGLLVIADPRMVQMGYGRRLFAALPPMSRLDSVEACETYLRALRERREAG
jgi:ATP-dependent DNA helicase DinG